MILSFAAKKDGGASGSQNNMPLIVVSAVAFIIIVALLLGVLFTISRKRAHATTWFPEGFLTSSLTRRRTPDGEEMK